MTTGRYPRRPPPLRPTGARRTPREENFFLVMVGCSLAVHVLAAAIFAHTPPPPIQHRPATVYVDLVLAPVANPQRGEAVAGRKMAVPVATPTPPPLPARAAKDVVVLKGKELKKEAAANRDDIAAAIASMRDKYEREVTEQDINRMKGKKLPAPQVAAAIGSPNGSGDEAGGAIGAWLQKSVREKWVWSGRKRKDLSAEVKVEFDSAGKLCNYQILRPSGDALFDKSLQNALLKLEPLPKALCKPFQETILFNLDDLQRP